MKKRIEIKTLYLDKEKYISSGEEVYVRGWVKTSRFSKNIGFIELTDGTSFKPLQLVITKDSGFYEELSKARLYASLKIEGKLVKAKNEKQEIELNVTKGEIEFNSDEDYPLQNKTHSFEFLREIAHLRARGNIFKATYKVRSLAAMAIHEYLQKEGYTYVHTPILTANDAEGAGETFTVTNFDLNDVPKTESGEVDYTKDFFGKKTSLTVSGQLNGEAMALAFGKIYTFGPTFRAENSHTAKHAAEFWMMEPEMAFVDLAGMVESIEDMMKYIVDYVIEHGKDEMKFLDENIAPGLIDRLKSDLESTYAKMTYTEVIETLEKAIENGKEFEEEVYWGIDLSTEHERYLAEEVCKKPVFVTNYPKEIKAFYMKLNEDKKTVAAMDLLVPGIGEMIGGSQREDNYDVLVSKMKDLGMNPEDYSWYLDLRKYGSVEHSGYGLGFERLIMYLTGMKNIRDVLLFPRTPNSCEF